MCIRDSSWTRDLTVDLNATFTYGLSGDFIMNAYIVEDNVPCLLYTSDAADERSSVDLGGRRIIKKKNQHTKPNT